MPIDDEVTGDDSKETLPLKPFWTKPQPPKDQSAVKDTLQLDCAAKSVANGHGEYRRAPNVNPEGLLNFAVMSLLASRDDYSYRFVTWADLNISVSNFEIRRGIRDTNLQVIAGIVEETIPMASSPVPFPSLSSPFFKQGLIRGHKLLKSGGLTIRSNKASALRRVSTQDFTLEEDDVLLTFLKERELNGDLIAKVSDRLWMRKSIKIDTTEADLRNDADQLDEPFDDEDQGGFLKLTATNEWLLGENTAPINKKMRAKQQRDDSERRTRLNLLQYEAV
ncbi:hypothetical protein Tco_1083732 [Tanacetum coccineum]